MAYNFLGLVNDINVRSGEVQLTSSNFSTATGYYDTAKEAVNSSVRHVYQEKYNWPFNHVEQDDTLVAGTIRYSYPSSAKLIDFKSFRIQRDGTFGNDTKYLRLVDYHDYVRKEIDDEYNTSDTGIRSIPKFVFRAPGNQYGVWPAPDQAYTVTYDYYTNRSELSAYDDVPTVPEQFRNVLVDGAMYYMHLFKGDFEAADRMKAVFDRGIDNMGRVLINLDDRVRDTRILRTDNSRYSLEVS